MTEHKMTGSESENNPELPTREAMLTWLAGALEIGGNLSFIIDPENIDQEAAPVLQISEKDPIVTETLQKIFEGAVTNTLNTKRWSISREKVVEIVTEILPKLVSRKPRAELVIRVDTSNPKELRDEILDNREMNPFEGLDLSQYESLIEDPWFLAGILDTRGTIFTLKHVSLPSLSIVINAKNKALLQAIVNRFGGNIQLIEAGKELEIMGTPTRIVEDSNLLTIGASDARKLLLFVYDSLLVKPEGKDRWSRTREMQQLAVMELRIEYIVKVIKEQRQKRLNGEPVVYSTYEDFARGLAVKKQRIDAVVKVLKENPEYAELLKEHLKYVDAQGKEKLKKLDEESINQIVTFLLDEIKRHRAGELETMTSTREISELYDISTPTIRRYILNRLPEDDRKYRGDFLGKEGTRKPRHRNKHS